MNDLELPSYIINVPFLNAIRRDNVSYVESDLKNNPCMRTALFYSVDENNALIVLEGILRPPVILLLTAFGYALLFGSTIVMKLLLKYPEASKLTCFVADCLDDDKIWKKHYRLIELPPIAMRKPSAELYRPLIENMFDFDSKLTMNCQIFKEKEVQLMTSNFETSWELFWSVWQYMKNIPILINVTSELLTSGCEVKNLVKRIHLEKLFRQCKQTKTSNSDSVCFLHVLIFHGVDLENEEVFKNFLNALVYLCRAENKNPSLLSALFMSIFNLSSLSKSFQPVIETIKSALNLKKVSKLTQQSLKLACVRKVRSTFCAPRYFRTIAKMKISKECKFLLLTGLPEANNLDLTGSTDLIKTMPLFKETMVGLQAKKL